VGVGVGAGVGVVVVVGVGDEVEVEVEVTCFGADRRDGSAAFNGETDTFAFVLGNVIAGAKARLEL
jgi:hypothetical protein